MVGSSIVHKTLNSHPGAEWQGEPSASPAWNASDRSPPLHVVHVVSSLELGGLERMVLDLSRGLVRRGHRVTVVSFAPGGALRDSFGSIETRTEARVLGGFDLSLVRRLRRLFRELAPDAVHTHNPTALLYGAPAAKWAGTARLVHTKHGANPSTGRGVLVMRQVLYRACDRVVAVSTATAELARTREHLRAPRLVVIPNGVDVDAYRPSPDARARTRAELGIDAHALVIGTVGRIAAEKNHALLLEAMTPILASNDRHLVLVGDGPLREPLERSVVPELKPRVHFVGVRWDVAAWLAAFDIFVLSSITEGLPLVIPEAMAAGLPLVCTAVGGVPGAVEEGRTGRLVASQDVMALRSALVSLLEDDAARARLGKNGMSTARQRYGLDRMVEAYEALYWK